MKEALFYQKFNEDIVKCDLCPHFCVLKPFEKGKCGVRENRYGTLYSLVYGRLAALGVDPIEKKPLYHFFPKEKTLSIATVGCNFSCSFCQNSDLSQGHKQNGAVIGEMYSPEHIIKICKERELKIISFTYSEPTIAFEYFKEIMEIAKKKDIFTVYVTNGYINPEPLKYLKGRLDAANIDLKSFSDEFYKKESCARLQPVLDSIKLYHQLGIWIELTTLIIPGKNDSDTELKKIAEFIAQIDKSIPWHISRFYPHFLLNKIESTPQDTLFRAFEIGKKAGLSHIYVGNLPGNKHQSTYCSRCGKLLISRKDYMISKEFSGNICPFCKTILPGRF